MAVNENDAFEEGADDARLAALYRSAAVEEPPERLDRLIGDAARAPLGAAPSQPRTPWWQAWRAPFAFAAVAVLSVSVVIVAQREGGEPLTIQAPGPSAAPPAAEPPVQAPAPPGAQADAPARPREPASRSAKSAAADAAIAREVPPDALPAPGVRRDERTRDEQFSLDESRLRSSAPAAAPKPMELPRERRATDTAPTVGIRGLEGELGEQRREKAAERASERLEPERPSAATPPPPAPAPVAPSVTEAQPAPPPPPASRVEAKPPPPMPRAKPESIPATKPLARSPAAAAGASSSSPPAAKRDELPTSALAGLVRDLEGRPPAQWIDRIQLLRGQGRRDDADALLAEFRRRYPDEPLPFSLQ